MYPSPFMTCLLIIGIVCLAVAPPLGIIFIILGVAEQRRMNRGHRNARQAALARQRHQAEQRAWRYFR